MATPAPNLNIPPSTATVDVSIIDTTGTIRGVPTWKFVEPPIKGHDWLSTPCFAFLIQHPTLKRSLVFDLGIKKDWQNLPPPLLERFEKSGYTVDVPKHVREILDEGGVDTKSIEAVVWSHWHFDHTGDPSTFEPETKLIVGPGCREQIFPGYPNNPGAAFLQRDVEGREIVSLNFTAAPLKIGRFDAIDYFGDGAPDSFILMGGDAVHHGGELRPHAYLPLPGGGISPDPFTAAPSARPCPGEMFEAVLRGGKRDQPFYLPAAAPSVHHDVPEMVETIRKLQECDAHDNVLVAAAHDTSLLGVADFFPRRANGFAAQGWVRRARWAFLKDFAEAVGYEGEIVNKCDFSPVKKN
ncbi:hypothetical protein KJ359_002955 [Pestalotiopsis sp. 9143b]|nr:hypothetical protein KJ359_002955 [Pestalotiopsis sp. 9143b]